MAKTVLATFSDRSSAERAVNELRDKGFDRDISILAKDDRRNNHQDGNNQDNDSVMNGVSTGGSVGGLLGLAAGAGAIAIPGIGPLLAVGPIAGLLSGAVTGGLAGGLADYGIPAEKGRFYEDKIKQGSTLVTVRCEDDMSQRAVESLSRNGGRDVETH